MSKPWTVSEVNRAKRLRDDGLTFKQIAERMPSRTANAIANFMLAYNDPRKHEDKKVRNHLLKKQEVTPVWIDPSEKLRVAIICSLVSYANDNRVDIDTAAHRLLSEGVA